MSATQQADTSTTANNIQPSTVRGALLGDYVTTTLKSTVGVLEDLTVVAPFISTDGNVVSIQTTTVASTTRAQSSTSPTQNGVDLVIVIPETYEDGNTMSLVSQSPTMSTG